MPHPLDDPDRPLIPGFCLGVIAPRGFAPKGVERFVGNKVRQLLTHKRRTHRVLVHGVWGQPAFVAACDLMTTEFSSGGGGSPGRVGSGPSIDYLIACVSTITVSHAVALFHGGGMLPPDMIRVLEVCQWTKTPVRVFAFSGEAVPL